MTADQTLNCCDCPNTFIFTARDQEFFAQRGFTPPRRCKTCRDQKKIRQNEIASSPQAPRPRPVQAAAPLVQYRTAPAVTEPPPARHEGMLKTFNRTYGPDAPPKSASREDNRGKKGEKGERRRDAYGERRQRRQSRDWASDEE